MASADPLSRYNEKRDFTRTSEPAGKTGRSTDGNLFIVQKHGATRLHWDFRLEADGVLKSWAITKDLAPTQGKSGSSILSKNCCLRPSGSLTNRFLRKLPTSYHHAFQ